MYDFGLKGNLPIFIFNFLAVRYFYVRIGHSSSHKFMQDQGVSQGRVLSVTLFNIHMSNILYQLPPSVRGMLYIDDLQVSCQGSDMRLIERQLQTTVNRLVKWCDQNGHTISPSKSSCVHFCRKRNLHPDPSIHIGNIRIPVVSEVRFLGVIFDSKLTFLPHVLYLRKKCERSLNILKVLSNTLWGADSLVTPSVPSTNTFTFGLWLYSVRFCSCICIKTTGHSTSLCSENLLSLSLSGAFRTSPVTSFYVVCHQPPLELRWRQLSANYFIRAMSVPSHPLKPFSLAIGLTRLYEARSFNIKPFSERAKAVLNDAHLNNINIQENNILAFPPWDIQIFNYSNPFSGYDKTGTAAIIYQQLFSYHRSKYSKYIPVYTDGSKTVGHVGCGVVFNNTILSFSLHNSMSVFSAELTAILIALQHILVSSHRHFCVYTDSMSALESLHFLTERRHPTVIEILLRKLEMKGFDIIFSWVPGHVGILGNEQADTAARSLSDHMQRPVCQRDLKTSTQNYIHRVWQETWDQQILNKLHNIHPSTSHWAALPMQRHDVRLTRLRIGHTRFTHRHLLLGENAPECPSVWRSLAKVGPCAIKINNHHHHHRVQQRKDSGLPRYCGLSFRKIGSRVGRNQTTVMRICDRWMQEGTTDRRGRSHPPQCTTSREDRQIERMVVMDRSVTSRTIAQHIESVTHHSVSARAIRRRLQQSGLSAKRPLLGLPLTQNHRRLRRQWCDERRM
ncbi:putative RNA-directed DNA polymerase from transposon X-element [Trichonephila clavipes]|nr:putative RNA-directed DNA polymerase from transposon X-element [Trichonephila clavipes]